MAFDKFKREWIRTTRRSKRKAAKKLAYPLKALKSGSGISWGDLVLDDIYVSEDVEALAQLAREVKDFADPNVGSGVQLDESVARLKKIVAWMPHVSRQIGMQRQLSRSLAEDAGQARQRLTGTATQSQSQVSQKLSATNEFYDIVKDMALRYNTMREISEQVGIPINEFSKKARSLSANATPFRKREIRKFGPHFTRYKEGWSRLKKELDGVEPMNREMQVFNFVSRLVSQGIDDVKYYRMEHSRELLELIINNIKQLQQGRSFTERSPQISRTRERILQLTKEEQDLLQELSDTLNYMKKELQRTRGRWLHNPINNSFKAAKKFKSIKRKLRRLSRLDFQYMADAIRDGSPIKEVLGGITQDALGKVDSLSKILDKILSDHKDYLEYTGEKNFTAFQTRELKLIEAAKMLVNGIIQEEDVILHQLDPTQSQ